LRRSAWLWLGLFWCVTLLSTGCGSSSGGSGSDALLRFLQASPDAPQVNVLIDGASVADNLLYANATGYISVNPGSHNVQVVSATGSLPIFAQTVSLNSGTHQTMLFTGPVASIQPLMLTDGGTTVTTGDGYVRVVNASAAMGAADVYLVPAGSGIVGVLPVTAGLTFDQDTGYQLIVAGNYEVFMTVPNMTQAFLDTGSISLTSAQNQTVVALDGTSGGFTYILLTDQ
jgi:hypothetical protein